MDRLNLWFVQEILPHDDLLRNFLSKRLTRPQDVEDAQQETYARILEGCASSRPQMAKAFLFRTARNLLTDLARRNSTIELHATRDARALSPVIEEITPERTLSGRQEFASFMTALGALPVRCRQVFWLRRLESLCSKQIARELGIAEHTVEQHMSKALRRLCAPTA